MALVVPIPVISLYITQFFYLPTEYEAPFQQYINYSLISFFFFQGVLAEGSCTSYIFLHNKLLQNLVALKKPLFYCISQFCGSEIWQESAGSFFCSIKWPPLTPRGRERLSSWTLQHSWPTKLWNLIKWSEKSREVLFPCLIL